MLEMSSNLRWLSVPGEEPLDRDGPEDVPFEPFDLAWISRSIPERFDLMAARYPSKTAVIDVAIRLTYAQVQQGSIALSRMIELRVAPGQPVGVLIDQTALFPIAALACLRGGRPVVPIDPGQPVERIALIVREAGLGLVIVDNTRGSLDEMFGTTPRLDLSSSLRAQPDQPLTASSASGPAFILYTSGSLGRPKGICNNQAAILHRVAQFTNACHLNADDRFLLLSIPGTIAGIRDIFATLLNGSTLVIAEPARAGFGGILRVMSREHVTVCYATPALLRALFKLRDASSAFKSLRILRLGGDIVWEGDISLCREVLSPACHILIGYGSTESSTVFQWFVPPGWIGDGSRMPCGRLVPNAMVALVDEGGSSVSAEEFGELLIRSEHIALGLWQNGSLQDGICEDQQPSQFFRSGDLVRFREDGLVDLVGRKARSFKLRGRRISPGELESVARSSSDVADAAVVVRRENGEATGMALFVVAHDKASPPRIADLQTLIARRLPAYMRPGEIQIIDEIPQLAGFKPDLAALVKMSAVNSDAPEGSASREETHVRPLEEGDNVGNVVGDAWRKVLNRKSIAVDEDWEAAGGDSLKSLSMVLLLEEALGCRVPLDILRQCRTPAELTDALRRQLLSEDRGSLPGAQADDRPLMFLMPGMGGDELSLAALRADLRHRVRSVLIDYPNPTALLDHGFLFEHIVNAAVGQVRQAARAKTIHFAGYSFGGFVAWEVARLLQGEGQRIGAVILLDSARSSYVAKLPSRRNISARIKGLLVTTMREPGLSFDRLYRLSIHLLVSIASSKLIFSLYAAAKMLPAQISTKLLVFLDGAVRARALNEAVLSKFEFPVTLFRSTDLIEESVDNGWRELCGQLKIALVDGSHVSMLEDQRRSALAARLAEVVEAADEAANTCVVRTGVSLETTG